MSGKWEASFYRYLIEWGGWSAWPVSHIYVDDVIVLLSPYSVNLIKNSTGAFFTEYQPCERTH